MPTDIPPEWIIPDGADAHLIKAIISACRRGSVNVFKKLYKLKGSRVIPPSYLVRLATTSRWPPMLEHIFKIHPLQRLQSKSKRLDTQLPLHERIEDLWNSILSAMSRGDLEIVELFLKAGMPLTSWEVGPFDRVETLLEQAIRDDQVEIVAMLLNYGANPNESVRALLGGSCIAYAAKLGRHAMIHLMMEHGGKIESSRALWVMAGSCSEVEAAQTVLDNGADINQIFTTSVKLSEVIIRGTALHAAAEASDSVHTKSTEFAKWLLDHGIDHTVKRWDGKTALQVAEERNHIQLRDLIINWIQRHAQDR